VLDLSEAEVLGGRRSGAGQAKTGCSGRSTRRKVSWARGEPLSRMRRSNLRASLVGAPSQAAPADALEHVSAGGESRGFTRAVISDSKYWLEMEASTDVPVLNSLDFRQRAVVLV